jgi:hypothetical protein
VDINLQGLNIMNARKLIAIASLAIAAGSAMAADYEPIPVQTSSTAIRSDVAGEARGAVAAGQVQVGEAPLVANDIASSLQRIDVRAEAARANREGRVDSGELLSFERHVAPVRG